jgi:mono/diheme cytochrome c family protein
MQRKRGPRVGTRTDTQPGEGISGEDRNVEDETPEADESDEDFPDEVKQRVALGKKTYKKYCSSCHGADREGSLFAYPSLENVYDRLTRDDIRTVIRTGPGSMPSFDQLSEEQVNGLLEFLQES